mmetsp:Transcript_23984/g.58624  ORF Transcript_23984/g.58624 Transcript_23984/m.58624 type:complete len:1246 (+) Transcript_23984:190-3927(+)
MCRKDLNSTMDHSEENNKDEARTILSEETIPVAPSFYETFRVGDSGIDLEQLRAFCLAPNGLVSPEWRKLAWPKLVGAHVEIWRAAAKIPPMDSPTTVVDDQQQHETTDNTSTVIPLHHPSKDEIAYIKQVVASCEWESIGILKEDAIVMPEHKPRPQSSKAASSNNSSSPTNNYTENGQVARRVSFHLPELAFSTRRQRDRKTLRKVLIHLKRTNPNLVITSATCSAVAMVLSIVQSSSLSTLVVQQLVAYPWNYSRDWPRSNNAWELDDKWQTLMKRLVPDLVQHFETNHVDVLEGTIRYSWIPSWLSQNISNKDLLARIWDVLVPSKPDAILYICIFLLSHFEKELLAETDATKIRSVMMDIPSKLDSMAEAEAVLTQAMEWMKEEPSSSSSEKASEETTEVDIPAWVTATVVPADSAMVEYARHLREAVTEKGKALISSEGTTTTSDDDDDDRKEKDWFSLEDPNSRFALTFKAKALKQQNENEARRRKSSSKSSWILVLFILMLAAAVIVGLETDCSILLGTKRSTATTTTRRSNKCLHQISDLYWEDAVHHISGLQTMGYKLRDEVRQGLLGLKMTTTTTDGAPDGDSSATVPSSSLNSNNNNNNRASSNRHIQEEEKEEEVVEFDSSSSSASSDAVMYPSENLGVDNTVVEEPLKNEETINEAPRELDLEDVTKDQEALDEDSESPASPEDDEAPRQLDLEEINHGEEAHDEEVLDESESESESESPPVIGPEDDTAIIDQDDEPEEAPEPPIREESSPDSSTADDDDDSNNGNMDDNSDAAETSDDDPLVEQSRRDAERLLKETLHQSEAASRLAESIVSQFVHDAKTVAAAGEKVALKDDAGAASSETTTLESSDEVREPEQSSDDHTTTAAKEEFMDDSDDHVAADDSNEVRQPAEQSSDDHTATAVEEEFIDDSDDHAAVDDSVVVDNASSTKDDNDQGGSLAEETRAERTTDETMDTEGEAFETAADGFSSPEQQDESSSKQEPDEEAPNGDEDDYDQTLSDPIVEDRVLIEDTEGAGHEEDLEEDKATGMQVEKEADLTAQDQSDSTDSAVEIEESESGTLSLGDNDTNKDADEGEEIDEESSSGDNSADDPSEDEEGTMSEEPGLDEYIADETTDDSAGDYKMDENLVETDYRQEMEPEPTKENDNDGETGVFGMAQGLVSRYLLGYLGSSSSDEPAPPTPLEIIHLSTPFFSKDDVATVFEQLMTSMNDGKAPHKQSKRRFNSLESTVLI